MGWLGDGLGWVFDNTVGRAVSAGGGLVWDQVVQGIVGWITDAVAWFVSRVLTLLEDTTKVDLSKDWFSGTGGPYRTVLGIAAVLLVGFLFVGIIQGVLAGDATGLVARMVRDLPLAVLGMVTTIAVTTKLLELCDELSRAVLRGGGDNAKEVLKVLTDASAFSGQTSFVVAALGLFVIIAALFVWVELVIRSALIYLVIAMSPLVFAAMVWPSARGMVRKLSELLLALIFSKLVIAIAFSVGAAALAGVGDAGHAHPGATGGPDVSAHAGTLFSGAVIFALAAFAPFVLLKLFPVVEGAVVAHGISRAPVHAGQSVASSAFTLQRLGGGASGGGQTEGQSRAAGPEGAEFAGGAAGPSPSEGAGASGTGEGAAGGEAAAAGAVPVTMVAAAAKKEFDAARDHPAQVADGMANLGRRSADAGGEESS